MVFHRLQLADGGIALRNLIFSSALSSAQRLRSRLATTITSGLAAIMLSQLTVGHSVSEVIALCPPSTLAINPEALFCRRHRHRPKVRRWRTRRRRRDPFAFTKLGAGRLHVFEICNQRLTTIFDVENAGKIANFLIQPSSPQLCRLPYISPVAFGGAPPVRRSCSRRRWRDLHA